MLTVVGIARVFAFNFIQYIMSRARGSGQRLLHAAPKSGQNFSFGWLIIIKKMQDCRANHGLDGHVETPCFVLQPV